MNYFWHDDFMTVMFNWFYGLFLAWQLFWEILASNQFHSRFYGLFQAWQLIWKIWTWSQFYTRFFGTFLLPGPIIFDLYDIFIYNTYRSKFLCVCKLPHPTTYSVVPVLPVSLSMAKGDTNDIKMISCCYGYSVICSGMCLMSHSWPSKPIQMTKTTANNPRH